MLGIARSASGTKNAVRHLPKGAQAQQSIWVTANTLSLWIQSPLLRTLAWCIILGNSK
jgi:ABC-type spermidine/putrescine transport system permease subunit I